MNIQIFGKSKCFGTKKAERFFKERGVKFQAIDLPAKGMSRRELESVLRAVGDITLLIDEKHKEAALVKYLLPDAQFEKLLEIPALLRTPIVRNGQKATVGEAEAVWKQGIAEG
ncbi:MAG: ArsC family transcriptional regulator, partial [Oscillospiraceae bacterium]|nr:ArsC family transcriptional regulator [Oscillospiraceae bacterium]